MTYSAPTSHGASPDLRDGGGVWLAPGDLPRGHHLVEIVEHRGWPVLRLTDGDVQADVVPGKGADILAVRWLPTNLNLLWSTPWGLRQQGSIPTAAASDVNFMENYPGGWQLIFPNGGTASQLDGVEQPFHGEACLAPWEYDLETPAREGLRAAVDLTTSLVRSPFDLHRRISVEDSSVRVTETVTNRSNAPREVMWSHHPALGAPFLSGSCVLDIPAATFIADDARDVPAGDLQPGARSSWPDARTRSGGTCDLRTVPAHGPLDRFGYLTDFTEGRATVTNPELGLSATISWDLETMPHMWFWLEAHATEGFPWFGEAYVLGLEPASSFPGQGIERASQGPGGPLVIGPRESRTTQVSFTIART